MRPITYSHQYLICLLCLLALLFLVSIGCAKEYSYERQPADTTAIVPLPVLISTTSCSSCLSNELPDSSWRLTIDGVVYCGKAERTIITLERTSFTFFGPSFCSQDSGFVASVYLDGVSLNADKTNLPVRLACFYYDQIGPSYVYMSTPGQPLQMTISRYDRATGLATGTFSGSVAESSGGRKEVRNGQFRIYIP